MYKKTFALIGASGFVARRHIEAIKDLGHDLKYIIDPFDSVGIIDNYFPNAKYFSSVKKFQTFLKKNKKKIDFLCICSPNKFHFEHIKLGFDLNSNVICEKPLVIKPHHVKKIEDMSEKKKVKCWPLLQLRHHKSFRLIDKYLKKNNNIIEISYCTPRGDWYEKSWKANYKISGGLIFNIGIHFFDILFEKLKHFQRTKIKKFTKDTIKAESYFSNAKVIWNLSISKKYFNNKKRTFKINNKIIDFSANFEKLHTKAFRAILKNQKINYANIYQVIKHISFLHKK